MGDDDDDDDACSHKGDDNNNDDACSHTGDDNDEISIRIDLLYTDDRLQLGDSWNEQERLLSAAVEKDKKRMEDLNRVLTTVRKIRETLFIFHEHVSHDEYLSSAHPLRCKRGLHSSK